MKESLQNIIDLVINPRTAFTRLKSEPKWVIVFTLYCLLSFLLAWTLMPYTQKLLTMRAVDAGDYNKTVSILSVTVFSTAYTILMTILLSVVLTVITKVVWIKGVIKFKHICSALFHIMLIRIMTFLVNAGLLPFFKDIEDIRTTIDARVIPGLHLLAGFVENRSLLMFLAYINPVEVWYVFVLTIGIHVLAEVRKERALFVAVLIWFFRAGLDTTFVTVFL